MPARLHRPLALALPLALIAACGGSNPPGSSTGTPPASKASYEKLVVKDPQQSAAFIAVDDLDGNGKQEIVLTTLIEQSPPGPPTSASRGALRVFSITGGAQGPWTEKTLIPTTDPQGYPFINAPQVFDVDEDGVKDLIVNTGFLTTLGGAQFWLKGPAFTQRSNFAPQTTGGMTQFFWHEASQADLDGDGRKDIVTTSVQTQSATNPSGGSAGSYALKTEWHRHLGNGVFEYRKIRDDAGGVFVKTRDIDADGDPDIVLTHFFGPPQKASVIWLEMTVRPSAANNYNGTWVEHEIDRSIGLGYALEFADMDGDGRDDLIVASHNHQDDTRLKDASGKTLYPPGLFYFTVPSDPRTAGVWQKHVISTNFKVTLAGSPASQGVPGIFGVGDLNGDGRPDLAVPGDGNDQLYAFINRGGGQFDEESVDKGEKMFGMALIADVDGDGITEIVAAKHNSADGGATLPPGFLKIYRRRP